MLSTSIDYSSHAVKDQKNKPEAYHLTSEIRQRGSRKFSGEQPLISFSKLIIKSGNVMVHEWYVCFSADSRWPYRWYEVSEHGVIKHGFTSQ